MKIIYEPGDRIRVKHYIPEVNGVAGTVKKAPKNGGKYYTVAMDEPVDFLNELLLKDEEMEPANG